MTKREGNEFVEEGILEELVTGLNMPHSQRGSADFTVEKRIVVIRTIPFLIEIH